MAEAVTVCRASDCDLDFVSQDGYLPERIIRRKLEDGDVFVAARGGERAGYLRLGRLWSKLPYVELIRVLESHRRAGVGGALLSFVEAETVARGHCTLYSSSQADEPESQAWHRRMGFEECGLLGGVNEGGVGEIFFRKLLTPDTKADNLAIRPLRASDAVQIAAAFAEVGWSKPVGLYERYLAEHEDGLRHVLVATVADEVAGYVTLNWQPTYAPFRTSSIPEVQDLNVLPHLQRKGIGSALLDAVESHARKRADTVGISVGLASDYAAAQRLYIRRGYLPDGRGLVWKNRRVLFGEEVIVDDDLVLCLTKVLRSSNESRTSTKSSA